MIDSPPTRSRRLSTTRPIASLFAIAIASGAAACSTDEGGAATSGATTTIATTGAGGAATTGSGGAGGGSAGGGQGGSGGAPSPLTCVSSPVPTPFAGTDDCPAPVPGVADVLDAALAKGGLDRCKVRFLPSDVELATKSGWKRADLFDVRRLPDFTPLHRGPLRLPAYGRETAAWLDAAAGSKSPVSGTIAALSARRGVVLDGAAFEHASCADLSAWAPKDDDATPLATAALTLLAHQGSPGDAAAVKAAAAKVPRTLQARLAPVIGAIDWASGEVAAALGAKTGAERKYLAQSWSLYVSAPFAIDKAKLGALDAIDQRRLAAAAAVLARTIEDADLGAEPDAQFDPFEVATPLGIVSVHGSGADTYASGGPAAHAALLFDLGGDDTYEVPAGATNEVYPVSVAIDVRGKDFYGYKEVPVPLDEGLLPSDGKGRHASLDPTKDNGAVTMSRTARQGAGIAGIGLLLDLGPEGDHYRSLAMSQGFASAGVGVLYDAGGDDLYESEIGSQGAGLYGIAALVDAGGDDVHQAFTQSQGYGATGGVGAIVDLAGDDAYVCDSGDPASGGHPLYLSPQLPGKGNTSMCQGVGHGRRADYPPGLAGGTGVLRDAAGKDRYVGSVFAQGSAFWQGIGMLLDGGDGADSYDGFWYVQGANAHYSLALLVDEGGDDLYDQTLKMAATSIGVGHDFSAALHLDLGGNDHYRAPGLSLGSGNINGIGILINAGGDDVYEAAGDPTLGAGNYSSEAPFGLPRQDAPTIGVFVDAGGKDTYTVGGEARALDGTTWSTTPQPYPGETLTSEFGCGADADGAATLP